MHLRHMFVKRADAVGVPLSDPSLEDRKGRSRQTMTRLTSRQPFFSVDELPNEDVEAKLRGDDDEDDEL